LKDSIVVKDSSPAPDRCPPVSRQSISESDSRREVIAIEWNLARVRPLWIAF